MDVGLVRYMGDGPGWPEDGLEQDQCSESWWWNLLYINNFEIKDGVPSVRKTSCSVSEGVRCIKLCNENYL